MDTNKESASAGNADRIRVAAVFDGETAGEKIAAAIADLPATGGIVEARGVEGNQTISTDPLNATPKPVTLLPGATIYSLAAVMKPSPGSSIIGIGTNVTILSVVSNSTNQDISITHNDVTIKDLTIRMDKSSGETVRGIQFDGPSVHTYIDSVELIGIGLLPN